MDDKKVKKPKKYPKLKGEMEFKAVAGKMLPVFVAKKLVRITDKEAIKIDCDSMEYSAINSLKKAIFCGDVEIYKAPKGGK